MRHRTRRRRRMLGVGALLIGGFAAIALTRVLLARHDMLSARDHLRSARVAATSSENTDAARALHRAATDLARARRHARSWSLRLLGPIPLVGSPTRAIDAAARAGAEAVKAGTILVEASASFPTSSTAEGVDGADLTHVHEAAVASTAAVTIAESHISRAGKLLDGPARAALPQVSGPARSMQREVRRIADQMDGFRRGLTLLAELTGRDSSVRILVLAQDSLELRPTGGYIGSFGVLRIAGGAMRLERYAATEDLPLPDPPLPAPVDLQPYLGAPWRLSNANWWPDFPTSATSARELFRRSGGGEVDAVLALTELATARLIGALGSITIPGYEPVTEADFDRRVVHEVELKRPLDVPRKKFLIELADALFDRLLNLPGDAVPDVVRSLDHSVGAGDIQLWFPDPNRQDLLAGTVIAGALPTAGRDFLLITDANITASKANLDLVKDIRYEVRRTGKQYIAELEMVVRNDGEPSVINPFYNGLARIYVPKGSRLLSASTGPPVSGPVSPYEFTGPRMAPADDGPYDVIIQRFLVEARGQTTITIRYELPAAVSAGGRYELLWLRQPGTPRDQLRAVVGGVTVTADPERRGLSVDESSRQSQNRNLVTGPPRRS